VKTISCEKIITYFSHHKSIAQVYCIRNKTLNIFFG